LIASGVVGRLDHALEHDTTFDTYDCTVLGDGSKQQLDGTLPGALLAFYSLVYVPRVCSTTALADILSSELKPGSTALVTLRDAPKYYGFCAAVAQRMTVWCSV